MRLHRLVWDGLATCLRHGFGIRISSLWYLSQSCYGRSLNRRLPNALWALDNDCIYVEGGVSNPKQGFDLSY
ncbi:hypothetical protein BDV26DRAFT_264567 [Aspergillus bertholletiae]|uniref:Uncharacterized protein n=1 Tax=Aspergillus bertholletiae TaxID=1226010 RepID=A0A5N7B4L6_9EURO|nr:hypothetical protein BDV26DRAFT_264567 [Aspergillus bertholletiae]